MKNNRDGDFLVAALAAFLFVAAGGDGLVVVLRTKPNDYLDPKTRLGRRNRRGN